MKIYFFTSNEHKLKEIGDVLGRYGVTLVKKDTDFVEWGDSVEEVVLNKAKDAYKLTRKPLITEDTAIFFHAYNDFPGLYAKRIFNSMGFKGLMKLLKGKRRDAHFKTCICLADKGKYKILTGIWKGRIAKKVYPSREVMAYEKIFIPQGYKKPLCQLSREEKNKYSHRARAAMKLGRYITHGKHV